MLIKNNYATTYLKTQKMELKKHNSFIPFDIHITKSTGCQTHNETENSKFCIAQKRRRNFRLVSIAFLYKLHVTCTSLIYPSGHFQLFQHYASINTCLRSVQYNVFRWSVCIYKRRLLSRKNRAIVFVINYLVTM